MATKNLVPRENNEGELGISTRKWKGINAVSGSFDELKIDNLLDIDGDQLLVAGVGVTITPESGKITIAATSSSDAQVDKIFAGPTISDVVQENSLVQTFYDASIPANNKIVFKTDNEERWVIDNSGHLVPKVNVSGNASDYNLGSLDARVNAIYVENDGINFKSHLHPQIQTGLNVTTKQKLQFGIYNSVTSSFDYDNVLIAKEDVKVASTSPLINLSQSSTNPNILKLMQPNNVDVESTITIDNIVLSDGDKVLIKDFLTAEMTKNGIYTVSGVGSTVILERIKTLNNGDDFSNVKVTVLEGTENGQQIFLTVPNVNSGVVGKAVGVDPMKWVRVSGGGGLKAIEEDLLPKLGADLNLNDKRIFNSGSTIRIAANANDDDNGGISISEISGLNTLKLSDSNRDNVLEFKDNNSSSSLRLYGTSILPDYTLDANKTVNFYFKPLTTEYNDAANHVDAIIATRAWSSSQFLDNSVTYATEAFVTSQGYLTAHQSLTSYIQTDDTAGLTSLTLTNDAAAQNSWTDNNAVTKSYVTNLIQGINKVLEPARVAIKSNVSLAALKENLQVNTTSQVTLSSGDRVLLAGQTNQIQNGVYLIAANGVGQGGVATERVADLTTADQAAGTFIFIEEGDSAESGFICAAPSTADTVGTHDLSFFKMSGIANTSVTNTSALTLANNALSVNVDGTTIEKINDPATTNPLSNQILRVKEIPVDLLSDGGNSLKIDASLLPDLDAETVNESKFNIEDVTDTATDLAAEDKFIIYDHDSSSTPKTAKITALNIDKYVRNNLNDVSGDIRLTFAESGATHGTLEAKVHNELYDNRVEKSDVTDANGDITRDGIVDEDLLLIRDSISTDKYGRTQAEFNEIDAFTDSNNDTFDDVTGLTLTSHDSYRNGAFTPSDEAKIKKVKYSTLKSKIAASISTGLDINGLPAITADNLGDLDELALFNMPPSSTVKRVLAPVRVHGSSRAELGIPTTFTGHPNQYPPKASAGASIIDGVTVQAGDRVLVSAYGQNNTVMNTYNGIYIVPASGNIMTLASDLPSGSPFHESFVQVLEGTQDGGKGYILTLSPHQQPPETYDKVRVGRMYVDQWDQTLENKKVTVGQLSDIVRKSVENYEVVEGTGDGEFTITVKSNKHYLLISPPLQGRNEKFILKFYNDGVSGNGYEAPIIGDTVKFSVLSRFGNNTEQNHPAATVECKFSANDSIHLNNKTLEKTITFFYQKEAVDDTEAWRHTKFNTENTKLDQVSTSTNEPTMTYPTTTSNIAKWFSIDGTSVYQSTNPIITLPDISEIVAHNIPLGTIKKFYFTRLGPDYATFKSDCIIVKRTGSTALGFGFKALEIGHTTPQIKIPLTGGFVNKVTVTLIGQNSLNNTMGWYIENAALESGSSELPTPTAPIKDKVLVYNSDTNAPVLEFSKLGKDNIELGVLEGGTSTASGGVFATTGNIKRETIVGGTNNDDDRGNIALNTVTKENLEKINNHKILGRIDLGTSPLEDDNTEHIDVITQLDEFTDEDGNIFTGLDALDKIQRFENPGNVIPTAKAIIQYIESQRLATGSGSGSQISGGSGVRQVNAVINDASIETSGTAQLVPGDGLTGAKILLDGTLTNRDASYNQIYQPWVMTTYPTFQSSKAVTFSAPSVSHFDPSDSSNFGKYSSNIGTITNFGREHFTGTSWNTPHSTNRYFGKYANSNMARIILPPAEEVYNLFGDFGKVRFEIDLTDSNYDFSQNTMTESDRANTSIGFHLLPNQSDVLYTYSDIKENFITGNTDIPTFISQVSDPDVNGVVSTTFNSVHDHGYIGFPKDANFFTSFWKLPSDSGVSPKRGFKVTLTLQRNVQLWHPLDDRWHADSGKIQPLSYIWIIEKL